MSDLPPAVPRRSVWFVSFGVFSLPLLTTMGLGRYSIGHDFNWLVAFAAWAPIWYGWAAIVPGLISIGIRYPLVGASSWRRYLAYSSLFAIVAPLHATLIAAVQSLLPAPPNTSPVPDAASRFVAYFLEMLLGNADFELMLFVCTLALSQAVVLRRRSHFERIQFLSMEKELADARVEALTRQLQPHFLFNALHAAAAVATRDPETAQRMVLNLRDLLDHSLADDSGIVTIERELELLADYLAIEFERFPDRLRVELDVSDQARGALLPCLLLQPLVENAILHGVAPFERRGLVQIMVRRHGQWLAIRVADDGPGSSRLQSRGTGIGLSNTRQRLRYLYGDRHRVEVGPGSRGWVVQIELPFAGTV